MDLWLWYVIVSFLVPAILIYGICLPILWLSDRLQPLYLTLRYPVEQDRSAEQGSGTACNANSFGEYYPCLQDDCNANCLRHWEACPSTIPGHLPQYSKAEQTANLRKMAHWNTMHVWFGRLPGFQSLLRTSGLKIWNSALHIPTVDPAVVFDFYEDISAATRFFVQSGEALEAGLDPLSIFSAVRLLWFICSFQVLSNRKVALDEALVAYCLIYPLTDNLLDDPGYDKQAKQAFNHRLQIWIREGTEADDLPRSRTEELVCTMLDAMAKVWPRGQYRAVHFALDAIHTAQSDSVQQSRGFGQISDAVLEEVSAMKGGASLLAAGYLICGDLSPKDLQYLQYLGLGFQLLDDLQDLRSDLEEERCTLFTDPAHGGRLLDARVGQLLHYVGKAQAYGGFTGSTCESLADYLLISVVRVTTLLVLEAVTQLEEYFSPDFMAQLEALSPVPFYALKSFRFENRLYDIIKARSL